MSKQSNEHKLILLKEQTKELQTKQAKGLKDINHLSDRVTLLENAYNKTIGGLVVVSSGLMVMLIREFIK